MDFMEESLSILRLLKTKDIIISIKGKDIVLEEVINAIRKENSNLTTTSALLLKSENIEEEINIKEKIEEEKNIKIEEIINSSEEKKVKNIQKIEEKNIETKKRYRN
jgi:hypothetical protein